MLKMLSAIAIWTVWISLGLLPVLAAGGARSALDSCYQSAKLRPDVGDCLERRLETAEAALERVAMAVHGNMTELDRVTGRPNAVPGFEDSERTFRQYRDRHCGWVGTAAAGGSGSGDMILDCMIRLTEQRTTELEARIPVAAVAPGNFAARPVPSTRFVARPDKAPPAGDVTAGEWRLTQLQRDGRSVSLPETPQATLSFDRNGMAAGRSFVNRYFGTANLVPEGHLSWTGALGSTKMAGPPDLMAREQDYLRALGRVSRWRVEGETLTLDSADGVVVLRYAR